MKIHVVYDVYVFHNKYIVSTVKIDTCRYPVTEYLYNFYILDMLKTCAYFLFCTYTNDEKYDYMMSERTVCLPLILSKLNNHRGMVYRLASFM